MAGRPGELEPAMGLGPPHQGQHEPQDDDEAHEASENDPGRIYRDAYECPDDEVRPDE
jgi:hypothetical protein